MRLEPHARTREILVFEEMHQLQVMCFGGGIGALEFWREDEIVELDGAAGWVGSVP